MKFRYYFLALSLFLIFATGCKRDPLEDYFVQATESPDFFVFNIPASIVEFDKEKMDPETRKEIESIKKVNILVYKNNYEPAQKKKEFEKAYKIIQDKAYKTLTKINNDGYNVSFAYEGDPEHMNKVVFLGKDLNYNFIIGIVKGENVSVKNLSKAFHYIKNIDQSQAQSIIETIKTDE